MGFMNRDTLKNLLSKIQKNDYKVPEDVEPHQLTMDMLNYIGDIDPELRDDLIYTTFIKWVINDVYNKNDLYSILPIVLDENHLFYKIGEVGDSVFTRTFSVLMLPGILYTHIEKDFLNKMQIS